MTSRRLFRIGAFLLFLAISVGVIACGTEATKKLNAGHLAYEDKKLEEAIKLYKEAQQLDPKNKDILSFIGRAQHDIYTQNIGTEKATESADAAIKAWEAVKEAHTDKEDAYKEAESQINEIFQRMGKDEVGTEYYKKLVEKSPSAGNYLLLADFLFTKQLKFEEGLAVVDEGLGKYSEDKNLNLTKGVYLWQWVYKEKTLPIDEKKKMIESGLAAIEKTISLPGQPMGTPFTYRALLNRQKAEVEPENKQALLDSANADLKKWMEYKDEEMKWRKELGGTAPPAGATPTPQ